MTKKPLTIDSRGGFALPLVGCTEISAREQSSRVCGWRVRAQFSQSFAHFLNNLSQIELEGHSSSSFASHLAPPLPCTTSSCHHDRRTLWRSRRSPLHVLEGADRRICHLGAGSGPLAAVRPHGAHEAGEAERRLLGDRARLPHEYDLAVEVCGVLENSLEDLSIGEGRKGV